MKKAEILFNKFSINLRNICKIFDFELDERFQREGYICPLSFQIHSKNGLSNDYDDQLTVEHIPPESLKGKGLCLTNRISNSQSGHSLDLALQNHIKLREFNEKVSPLKTTVYIEKVKLEGTFDFTNKDKPKIKFISKSQHLGNERVKNKILTDREFKFNFSVQNDGKKTSISLLRTAYLYAFGHIGYSLLFGVTKLVNQNYKLIREQILNPDKSLINNIVIINKNLDNASLGVNIVYDPKEFRSIFVVFPVISEHKEWLYGVFLPGPDDYGFEAINNIKDSINDKNFRFKYYNFPKIDITNIEDNRLYYENWTKHNGIYRT